MTKVLRASRDATDVEAVPFVFRIVYHPSLCQLLQRLRPQHVGHLATDFTLQDSDHKVTLSQFRGQVVILNFWATWCPPCVEETPSLVRMQEQMKGKGVTVVAVSIDEDAGAYHRFLKDNGVNFLTVRDPYQKISALYGTFGWPETYIIDRKGRLRRKLVGPVDWSSPEVVQFLNAL